MSEQSGEELLKSWRRILAAQRALQKAHAEQVGLLEREIAELRAALRGPHADDH